ncbi:uncharacterized protein LOC136067527 [Quercus suber]|uniref:uncharacterized protein LOC136067527 n=1 Tax=Quercus suber TaxID=58331 RepID=UPI0032E03698
MELEFKGRVGGVKVEAVDTTGAGDAFIGGILNILASYPNLYKILETTYEGTKKVKDTKLQMLTTQFVELKMSEDESFDSFYSKLNEVIIGKFNLGEKIEDSKIVKKIFWSLPESFHAKVIAIEESKDLDDIKVQELIDSLQTYELSLPLQRTSAPALIPTECSIRV